MKTLMHSFIVSLFFILLVPQISQPCTTFFLNKNGNSLFGRNYDWFIDYGLIIINKRNVSKAAEGIEKEYGTLAHWTSKYGSLTFNQLGRELPMGGINETGLVVESMILMNSTYPAKDNRLVIGGTQWIQYQLDNCSKVAEVIASDSQIRIYEPPGVPRGHYLVADKEGNCATIEFLNGKLVYHTGETLPIKVLANDIYHDNLENLKIFKEFGGNRPMSRSSDSLDRFARVANMLNNYSPDIQMSPIDYAFNILDNAAQPSGPWETQWRIVYDIRKLRIYFQTVKNKNVQFTDLSSFDFSCQSPVKVMNMNDAGSGDITGNFHNYTQEENFNLIRHSFKYFAKDIPDDVLEHISKLPERTSCNQQK